MTKAEQYSQPKKTKLRWPWLYLTGIAFGLAGCAQERIRDESQQRMRTGEFEQAIGVLDSGLKQYPESPLLRSGLIQSRNEALAKLLTEAANERSAGNLDAAEEILKRALPFDTSGKRVNGLLAELAVARRQRVALTEGETLLAANKPREALRVVQEALKDNPRQSDLVALQRRIEAESRRGQVRAAQLGLSETRLITLDFRDASLRTVLDVVTRNSGVNFILDKDIRQDTRVTVLLRSARVEDAIDLIVSTHQLTKKVIDSQTILIYPNTPEKQREHQEQVVRVFYLSSAEAKSAAAFLRSMLKVREPFVDERTNMVAIRESADTVELADRLMALYDTSEPEVLLELEVMEVRTSRLTDLGVKFPSSLSLTPLSPTGTGGLTLGNIRGLGADRIALGISGLLVNFKREIGDFNTLANPRIRARNKEKAKVLIGDKVPVITTTTSQGGFVGDSVSYLDVGLKLDVEPTVYADDEVAIRVSLEVSSIAREVRTGSGSLAYQIGTRQASTSLRLRDGETQLLAGLISNDERTSASRVPGLGDLPVAGRLFSQQSDDYQRTELVLAITPRVLRNVRRPDASETELWIGTEASPRIRAVGGLLAPRNPPPSGPGDAPTGNPAGTPGPAGGMIGAPAMGTPAAGALPAGPASVPRLNVRWQAPAEVAIGATFVATLDLSSTVPLRGMPMQLRYPPEHLQLLDIEEGDFFRADGGATSFTSAIDAKAGTGRAGVLRRQASGTQGQGGVVRMRFKALAAGAAEIALTQIDPVSLGEQMPSIPLPQTTRVQIK